MDTNRIKELIEIMKDNNLKLLKISVNNESIEIEAQDCIELDMPERAPQQRNSEQEKIIKSPMPGIIYRSPSPEAKPYIELSECAKAKDVLCVIEAMKMLHEVRAGDTCEIIEIYFKDGQLVEFGEPLFKVKEVKDVFKASNC